MKSVQINNYGGSDIVKINDNVSIPKVTPSSVPVKVKASGVNPVDWKIRDRYFQQTVPLQFPVT